jgi:HlyD family secretion protein
MSTATELDGTTTAGPLGGPAPARPARGRPRGSWRTWRARAIVVLMIAVAVPAGTRLAASRDHRLAQFDLGAVTLTAPAIGVESDQVGRIRTVDVAAQEQVVAGQRLGTVVVTTVAGNGRTRYRTVTLNAPADGIISGEPRPVGGIVQPGVPFVQMYDPAELTFDAAIRVDDLGELSTGMVATLRAKGLRQPIAAVVERVVPRIGTADDQTRMHVVLTPRTPADVARLVPGLRFTGTVDTRSGPVNAGNGLQESA